MKKNMKLFIIMILTLCLTMLPACRRNIYKTNALETMTPGVYSESENNDNYFGSLSALEMLGPKAAGMKYPSIEHLLYIYIEDCRGNGNPTHSLLIDIKYSKAYYSINLDFLSDGYWRSNYSEVDLSQTDIEAIIGFQSVQGILDWEYDYSSDKGETAWKMSLYFDDGSYFQTGGEYYPEEYEKLEEDIWPLLSDKTGEELWWMKGRP